MRKVQFILQIYCILVYLQSDTAIILFVVIQIYKMFSGFLLFYTYFITSFSDEPSIYAMRGLSAVVRHDELGQCEGLDAWDG